MRILFVTPFLPAPTNGTCTRALNLIRELARRHQVAVISFARPLDRQWVAGLEPHCQQLVTVPMDDPKWAGAWQNRLAGWRSLLFSRDPNYLLAYPYARMRNALRALLASQLPDVVVFEFVYLAQFVDLVADIPCVLDQHNVESDVARRQLARARNPVHKFRDWLAWRKLDAFERRWVKRFAVCVAVSERDARLLKEMSPGSQLHVVPNGVDCESFAPQRVERACDSVLFFGTLNYGPNVDGLVWFCEEVWPRVHAARPDATLHIVGLNPLPRVVGLGRCPAVQVVGFVPDIRDKLWRATLSVVPLQVGGGTRLKILEAMAAGCPIVSTSIGAEGLAVQHNQHLLLADDAQSFAQRVVDLLDSEELRKRLSQTARQLVCERYNWRSIALLLEAACEDAIRGQRSNIKPRGPSADVESLTESAPNAHERDESLKTLAGLPPGLLHPGAMVSEVGCERS